MHKSQKFNAIIFDCFGVLTSDTIDPFYAKYLSNYPAQIDQVKNLSHQSDLGEISYSEFIRDAAGVAQVSENEAGMVFFGGTKNQPLFDFINDSLRPVGYKIGLLSNLGRGRLAQVLSDSDLRSFDATTLSCKLGVTKPDARIYRIAAQQLKTIPEDCVFVDDHQNNVLGAERVGMAGILYDDFANFQAQLAAILSE